MAERDEDGFLGRWSRRKIEARREAESEQDPSADADAVSDEADEAAPDEPRERHPAEDIDIESLGRGADFRIFMEKGVPAAVRSKALRKLWRSDPVFANLDGLDDYFDLAKPERHGLGPIRATSWNLGRGFLTEQELAPDEASPEDAVEDAEPFEVAEDEAAPQEETAAAEEPEGPSGDDPEKT